MGKWATEGGQVQEESIQSEADVDVERRNPLLFLKDQHRTKMNQAVTLLIFHTIALRPTGKKTVCKLPTNIRWLSFLFTLVKQFDCLRI